MDEEPRPSIYLILYNIHLAIGWFYVLSMTAIFHAIGGTTAELWQQVAFGLKVSQTAAVLEILHSALRLVRSPLGTTVMQVFSRIWVLWGIINIAQQETTGQDLELFTLGGFTAKLNLFTLLYAWSITEVIRYLFYAFKEIDALPYAVTWMRYTFFLVLYPLGVSSEMAMVWLALPKIKSEKIWSISMPNAVNFEHNYYITCLLIVAGYLPGFPQLFSYMLTQRKKVLGGGKQKQKQS